MTNAPTLAAFLLARIAEDEAAARAMDSTAYHRWRFVSYVDKVGGMAVAGGSGNVALVADDWHANGYVPVAAHIARHDPARVLAECEAKRRIVELHRPTDERNRWCDNCKGTERAEYPCATLRALASIWADHPDYREEWRP